MDRLRFKITRITWSQPLHQCKSLQQLWFPLHFFSFTFQRESLQASPGAFLVADDDDDDDEEDSGSKLQSSFISPLTRPNITHTPNYNVQIKYWLVSEKKKKKRKEKQAYKSSSFDKQTSRQRRNKLVHW